MSHARPSQHATTPAHPDPLPRSFKHRAPPDVRHAVSVDFDEHLRRPVCTHTSAQPRQHATHAADTRAWRRTTVSHLRCACHHRPWHAPPPHNLMNHAPRHPVHVQPRVPQRPVRFCRHRVARPMSEMRQWPSSFSKMLSGFKSRYLQARSRLGSPRHDTRTTAYAPHVATPQHGTTEVPQHSIAAQQHHRPTADQPPPSRNTPHGKRRRWRGDAHYVHAVQVLKAQKNLCGVESCPGLSEPPNFAQVIPQIAWTRHTHVSAKFRVSTGSHADQTPAATLASR